MGLDDAANEVASLWIGGFFLLRGAGVVAESRSSAILTIAPSLNPTRLAASFRGFGNLLPIEGCSGLAAGTVDFGLRVDGGALATGKVRFDSMG